MSQVEGGTGRTFYESFAKPRVPWTDMVARHGAFSFEDVLLRPNADTQIESRSQISTAVQFGPYELTVPIISAPMDTISGEKMICALHELGAMGSLPRPNGDNYGYSENLQTNLDLCERFSSEGVPCLYSVGLKNGLQEAEQYKLRGGHMVLIDVAHGGMSQVARLASEIKNRLDMYVVAGNIVTYDQAEYYHRYGVDIARVGVGPGSACTTREKTGVGYPQLSAILETTEAGIYVIADGGVKKGADVAKALAAGAKMVMVGGAFAGTLETPGEVINGRKSFRGQASSSYMKDNGVSMNGHRTDEGIQTYVPVGGSVVDVVNDFMGGLKSAMSYVGAKDIHELQQNAQFVYISPSTQQENRPHITNRI